MVFPPDETLRGNTRSKLGSGTLLCVNWGEEESECEQQEEIKQVWRKGGMRSGRRGRPTLYAIPRLCFLQDVASAVSLAASVQFQEATRHRGSCYGGRGADERNLARLWR